MESERVKAIVEREIDGLKARFGIAHWRLRFEYRRAFANDNGELQHGECTRLVDYNVAHIMLNPESFEDEADVLSTLRHELFHVILSPFDLYSSTVTEAIKDETQATAVNAMLDRVWYHVCEKAVVNLERMYKGLTERPADPSTPNPGD